MSHWECESTARSAEGMDVVNVDVDFMVGVPIHLTVSIPGVLRKVTESIMRLTPLCERYRGVKQV